MLLFRKSNSFTVDSDNNFLLIKGRLRKGSQNTQDLKESSGSDSFIRLNLTDIVMRDKAPRAMSNDGLGLVFDTDGMITNF